MPIMLTGNVESSVSMKKPNTIVAKADNDPYDYAYPDRLDLKPGSVLHDRIRDEVLLRARAGQDAIKSRFDDWRAIDHTLTTYMEPDEAEVKVKEEDYRKPVSMVVPVSYATLETLLTYNTAAFIDDPLFKYEGHGPEDVYGAMLLELVVAQQCRRAKVALDMHTMWRSGYTYGFAPMHIGWNTETAMREVEVEETRFSQLTAKFTKKPVAKEFKRVDIFSGGKITPIDVYKTLPDPDTPIHRVQDASFFGWVDRKDMMSWLMDEESDDNYFNMLYLKHMWSTSTFWTDKDSGRYDKHNNPPQDGYTGTNRPTDVITMYIRLIPEDWNLGVSEYPETWGFAVAGDKLVVRAQPLLLLHGKIPVTVNAPETDGFTITPISKIETIAGIQTYINWLFQSRITNVRKAINDMLIVDPQLVNIHDLKNPKPGKLIRLRRQAWGRGVKDAVMQLDVNDVTSGHIGEVNVLREMSNWVSGAQDAVSGVRRQTSERVSATEAAGTAQSALSRLEHGAMITSMQAHQDIAQQMASNTMQFMNENTFVKIVGDWAKTLKEDFGITPENDRVKVKPENLDVAFDVITHDGSVASKGNAQLWTQLLQVVLSNEGLMAELDGVKMFKHAARVHGAKNINDFVRRGGNVQAEILPDDQVEEQVRQGNLVPTPV